MTKIQVIKSGESLPFTFDRGGESITNWICTIEVKQYPGGITPITRIIPAVGDTWPGYLTSAETELLVPGLYRLVGVLTNSTTDEEEQVPIRFNVTGSWSGDVGRTVWDEGRTYWDT